MKKFLLKCGLALIACLLISLIDYLVLLHYGFFWFAIGMVLMSWAAMALAGWLLKEYRSAHVKESPNRSYRATLAGKRARKL